MSVLRRFLSNSSGAFAVVFALSLAGLMGFAGVAVDGARLYSAQAALQAAADGAAIAAAADAATEESKLQEVAEAYLKQNAPPQGLVSVTGTSVALDEEASAVVVELSGSVPMLLMGVIGYNEVPVSSASTVQRSSGGPLELVLALDVTSSMNQSVKGGTTRRQAMSDAAVALVTAVMASPYAKVGFVAFSNGTMRVDTKLKDEGWLDIPADIPTVPSCAWNGKDCTTTYFDCIKDGAKQTCQNTTCKIWDKVCSGPGLIKWNGCIRPRTGHLSSIASPTSPPYRGGHMGCGGYVHDLTGDPKLAKQRAQSLSGGGDTYIPSGLLWAWNLLEPEAPFTTATTLEDISGKGGRKAVVLMTDGANTMAVAPATSHDTQSVLPVLDKAGNLIDADGKKQSDEDTRALCTNIKNAGITLFTVAFDIDDEDAVKMLAECASDADKAFDVTTAQEVRDAFGRIGQQLLTLRIMK